MGATPVIETLLLATTPVATFKGRAALTAASGFFYRTADRRLFLVTCRHVLLDAAIGHQPDRIEIEVHTDRARLSDTTVLSLLLHREGEPVWREGSDAGGDVDVAAIEIDSDVWPDAAVIEPFVPADLLVSLESVRVGAPLLVPGYPLGFHDTVHRLPVVRLACVASAFGIRFQGQGCFLTDARTHRGSSGAPVVLASAQGRGKLLGIHSSRLDMRNRHQEEDESLGLNCAWYAGVIRDITAAE
jgi:S1-C subfamily serine protease